MSTMRSGAPTRRHALDRGRGRYPATPILSTPARHLVNRFSYGITPALADEVRAAGDHLAWFDQQVATAYDGSTDDLCDWWPDLHLDPATLWKRASSGGRSGFSVMQDYGRRVLMRRMTSPRQLLEVMTEFWENHFHVPTNSDNAFVWRASYGEMLRANALGRFEDLLGNAVLHPSMLLYLGAATSTKLHPNENLGRELLELHTVGIGNYTEADVQSSARILTGYQLDYYKSWRPFYRPSDHWTGPVKVMGFSHANGAADGQDVARSYLSYLARHPATARRIATKLVQVFVADTVPSALVDRLADVYLAEDTAIVPVLRALVTAREFGYGVDAKVRDADRDVVATYRLLGVDVASPSSDESAGNLVDYQASQLGLAPFTWPRPDGKPIDNQSWVSPTRALGSMALHWDMASRSWPSADVTYRPFESWLPSTGGIEFRELVDHLARLLLQRPSSALLLRSCCEATGFAPTTSIRPSSVADWNWPRLIVAVLDSPDFYQY